MKSVSTLVTAALAIALATAAFGLQPAAAQPTVVSATAPVYVVAVGDIACDPSPVGDPNYSQSYNAGNGTLNGCRQKAVGAAVMAAQPDQFWALGDNQYFNGTYAKYMEVYDKAFGALKGITHPIPGNHEWKDLTLPTKPGSGYFTYFGAAAHPETNGTYSFDAGDWHVLAINDNECDPSHPCGPGSALATWIATDMAASTKPCTVAMWHHPLWSVGGAHAEGYPPMVPVWNQLHGLGVDMVLTGHDHLYVRTKPLGLAVVDPSNPGQVGAPTSDPTGMVEFVIGTGGEDNYAESVAITDALKPFLATYAAKQSPGLFGAAGFHLKSDRYTYSYLPAKDSATFTDNGGRTCRRATQGNPQDVPGEPVTTPPTTTLAAQQVTWAPTNTSVQIPTVKAGSITPSAKATSSGDGAIVYSVTSEGTTGCTVDVSKGIVKYTDVGECEVTATAAGTAKFAEGSQAVVFTIASTAVQAKPDITVVEPATGPRTGGNTITIAGHNFTGTTKVTIGGKSAKFEAIDDTHISAMAPLAKQDGRVTIVVTVGGPRGAATAPDIYTYEAGPATTAAAPAAATATAATPTVDEASLGNPEVARALLPGLKLMSRADAAHVLSTLVKRPPAMTPGAAPTVRVKARKPFALLVRGQPAGEIVELRASIRGKSVVVGSARVDAKGSLRVPAMIATRLGAVTLSFATTSTDRRVYVKVLVVK